MCFLKKHPLMRIFRKKANKQYFEALRQWKLLLFQHQTCRTTWKEKIKTVASGKVCMICFAIYKRIKRTKETIYERMIDNH